MNWLRLVYFIIMKFLFFWNEVVIFGIGVIFYDLVKRKKSFVVELNWYKEYI